MERDSEFPRRLLGIKACAKRNDQNFPHSGVFSCSDPGTTGLSRVFLVQALPHWEGVRSVWVCTAASWEGLRVPAAGLYSLICVPCMATCRSLGGSNIDEEQRGESN